MKILVCAIAALVLVGCGGSSSPNTGASVAPVVGEWLFTYPGSGCEERYSFKADGSYTASSLDERFSGIYTYYESHGRSELAVAITADNGMADCLGVSEDNTAQTVEAFVEFVDSDTMSWFAEEDGGVGFTLTRQ